MTNTIYLKKVTFLCLAVFFLWGASDTAQAQDTKPSQAQDSTQVQASTRPPTQASQFVRVFRPFSLGFGFSFPLGNGGHYPLWIGAQYIVNDKIGVGLRYGYYSDIYSLKFGNSKYHLISMQGDYFFINHWPWYLSAGLGLVSYHDRKDRLFNDPSLGIAPRVRARWALFELGLAYYFTFDSKLPNDLTVGFGLHLSGDMFLSIKDTWKKKREGTLTRYTFRPFSVGLGILTGIAGTPRGVMSSFFWIEPQVLLESRKVSLGVRFEYFLSAQLFGPPDKFWAFTMQVDRFIVHRYPIRVSAGLGLGAYRYAFYVDDEASTSFFGGHKLGDEGTSFGIAPRVRFQWYFLELGMSAHLHKHPFVVAQLGLQMYGKKKS